MLTHAPVLIGLLQHRERPTYYSPSSRTALAEAEISWKDDHKSTSVYVYFEVAQDDMSPALRKAWEKVGHGRDLGLAIWTTTAWTLAANQVRRCIDFWIEMHADKEYRQ